MALNGNSTQTQSNTSSKNSSTQNWTYAQPNTARIKKSNWRYLKWFIFFVCGLLIFYSVVPWQSAGYAIGNAIVALPIIRQVVQWLQRVPLVGLFVSLIVWILPNLMAVLLWGLTQLIEITPVLLHDPKIYDAVVRQLRTHQATQPNDSEDAAKFQKKITHYLVSVFRNIGVYAALAYTAEIVVNVWFYLPYGNGWNDFMRDFLVWDAALIKWADFFLMLGSIGIVEVLILFMLNVHRLFKAITPRTERHV